MKTREIKFRAWEENGKNMIHYDEVGDHTLNSLTEELPYILMQYTGLKDINGKEIYEGDIVQWGMNGQEMSERVAVVELFPALQFKILYYINGKTRKIEEGDGYIFGYSNFIYRDTHKSLEVIGNIYENKDLIKTNE